MPLKLTRNAPIWLPMPPLPLKGLEEVFLADAEDRYDGPLWLAQDGDLYSLPAGGGELQKSNMIGRGR